MYYVNAMFSQFISFSDGNIICQQQIVTVMERVEATLISVSFSYFRLAILVEKETEAWYKMDPDPFDDRHPGK